MTVHSLAPSIQPAVVSISASLLRSHDTPPTTLIQRFIPGVLLLEKRWAAQRSVGGLHSPLGRRMISVLGNRPLEARVKRDRTTLGTGDSVGIDTVHTCDGMTWELVEGVELISMTSVCRRARPLLNPSGPRYKLETLSSPFSFTSSETLSVKVENDPHWQPKFFTRNGPSDNVHSTSHNKRPMGLGGRTDGEAEGRVLEAGLVPSSGLASSSLFKLNSDPFGASPKASGPIKSTEVVRRVVVQQGSPVVESLVRVPDLFSSIMASKALVNPNYEVVKKQADTWIARLASPLPRVSGTGCSERIHSFWTWFANSTASVIGATDKWTSRNVRVDLAYLASTWAPYCDAEALRVMIDWNHWVFLFDDQFDEGHLTSDPTAAQEEIQRTLAIMDDTNPPAQPEDNILRYVFQTTWDRMKKLPDLQHRWREMHRRFFNGLITQVQDTHNKREFTRDVSEYMAMRRGTIGVYPAIALTEYALGIQLANEIFDHPSLQECMCVSSDLVILVNDLLSYKKDLALGVDHNLITLLKAKGRSIQEAVDEIGAMIDDCYKRWYRALANLPVFGEHIDHEVLKFIDACRNVALGNLHWSFKTGRYLGPDGDTVRKTRMMRLPASV
ncbi:hypothetical protein BBP40_003340 [Aspergillus hancockii]|nr:hypothetical protein BBP40_003340 [Aspergillus hancockii]